MVGFQARVNEIKNVNLEWLIDTGCTVTIILERGFDLIPTGDQQKLKEYVKELFSDDENETYRVDI